MFDPTVYENLKVVLEGAVYDLDLNGQILVVDRKDIVDLAKLERTYMLRFKNRNEKNITGEVKLHADIGSFTDELLHSKENVGCDLTISIYHDVDNLEECDDIARTLALIWNNRPTIKQMLTFTYPMSQVKYQNKITISFNRKITEAQIDDLPGLIDLTLQSMRAI